MKQLEPKQVTIGENDFYIRPLPAFKAANLSGELAALLMPLAAGLFSLFPDGGTEAGEKGLFDIDVKDAAPVITKAFSSLSGDKVEELLRHLLLAGRNISVELPGERVQLLTEDLVNEIFCEDVQDMFILAFEVIRINYNGFFKKLGSRFGALTEGLTTKLAPGQTNMASSI